MTAPTRRPTPVPAPPANGLPPTPPSAPPPQVEAVAAPVTGLHLGRGRTGPVVLRLFRRDGTRVAVLGAPAPARLLVLRAVAAGVPTAVVTPRPAGWSALGGVVLAPPGSAPDAGLVADEARTNDVGPVGAVKAWQCRVEFRTPFVANDVVALTNADLVVTARLDPEVSGGMRGAFGLSRDDARVLTSLDPGSFAAVHRGRLQVMSLDPTPPEQALLARLG
ncbi:MAG: hypothetical protein ACTHMS_07720 [Jatrophihabitans sp.]|uniref:hypothetical protein n=1 Tax=Jatrophihabitans sp. TaxID=1932789 RepID=UPI003F7EFAE7